MDDGLFQELTTRLDSPDENVRRQSVLGLLQSREPLAIPVLARVAASDASVEIRYYARRAMHLLRDHAGIALPATDRAMPEAPRWTASDPGERLAALREALTKPAAESVEQLRVALDREVVPELIASFIVGLGRLGGSSDIERLRRYLIESDPRIRANAVEALATIGGDAALTAVLPAIQDPDNRVRQNAILALAGVGGPELLRLLRDLAHAPEVAHRDSAIFSLSRCDTPLAVSILVDVALNDAVPSLRLKAAEALSGLARQGNAEAARELVRVQSSLPGLPPPRAVPWRGPVTTATPHVTPTELAAIFADPTADNRQSALARLPAVLSPEYVAPLVTGLERERDPILAAWLVALLGRMKAVSAFAAISARLYDADDRVRANAVDALVAIDASRARGLLGPLLHDVNNRVRANAILAFAADPAYDPTPDLSLLVRHPQTVFRKSALYCMALLERGALVHLLAQLLDDEDAGIRRLAFTTLQDYARRGIPGTAELEERIRVRRQIARQSDSFFENEFDRWFGFIKSTLTGHSAAAPRLIEPPVLQPSPPPIDEDELLVTLGAKAESCGLLPAETIDELKRVAEALAVAHGTPLAGTGQQPGVFMRDAAARVERLAQAERREAEVAQLLGRRRWLRRRAAQRLLRQVARLTQGERDRLGPILESALAMQQRLVPPREVSLLPEPDASVLAVFDLSMRIFQKHVVAFSVVTMLFCVIAGVPILVTGHALGNLRMVSSDVLPTGAMRGILIFGTVGWFFLVALALACSNVIIALMVRAYLAGEHPAPGAIWERVKTLAFPVTRAKVAKYGMVMLHGAAGFIMAVGVDLLLFNWIGRRPAVRVVAELFVIGAVLWAGGRVLIRHLLVESIMVFERSGVRSAFARSGRLVAPRIGRTLELLASSWILLVFIGISTGEVLDVVRWILPFPAVWQGVAISTQICLMPIVLINIVVYALMLMRPEFDEKGAATPIGL